MNEGKKCGMSTSWNNTQKEKDMKYTRYNLDKSWGNCAKESYTERFQLYDSLLGMTNYRNNSSQRSNAGREGTALNKQALC